MNRRGLISGFVLGAVVALAGAFAIAGQSGQPLDDQLSPASQKALSTSEPPPPPLPSSVSTVHSPNRIGDIPPEVGAACDAKDASGEIPGDPPGVPAFLKLHPPDELLCDVAKAVDAGVLQRGEELSNEELESALKQVDSTPPPVAR